MLTIIQPWTDPTMQRKAEWVAQMQVDAKASANELGVSPEAITAQSALETGWGAHVTGQHNLFGIKADASWHGQRVLVHTREVLNGQSIMMDDWFRDYPSFAESIADHLEFLKKNSRYREAGVFDKLGDEMYFYALQRAGYATDPKYASQLIAVRDTIRNYFLPRMTAGLPLPIQPRTMSIGDRGTDVMELQLRLQNLGFDPRGADGWFGNATQSAVMAFQRINGLAVDGVVGSTTRATLNRKDKV